MDRDSGFSGWEEKSFVQSEGALALTFASHRPLCRGAVTPGELSLGRRRSLAEVSLDSLAAGVGR